jgi:hypothetical protein
MQKIYRYLLSKRNAVSKEYVESLLAFCRECWRPNDVAYNKALLNYLIMHLTFIGLGNVATLDSSWRILSFDLLNRDFHVDDPDHDFQQGGQHELALALRISALFKHIFDMDIGANIEELGFERRALRNLLLEELLGELETLRILHYARQVRTGVAMEDLYVTNAENILAKLIALPDAKELSVATGWKISGQGAHAIYVNFCRHDNQLVIRVDNLNPYEKQLHGAVGNKIRPKVLGQLPLDKILNLKSYIVGILKSLCLSGGLARDQAIRIIYNQEINLANLGPTTIQYPEFDQQAHTNCYMKSHEPGLYIRLNNDRLFQWFFHHQVSATIAINSIEENLNLWPRQVELSQMPRLQILPTILDKPAVHLALGSETLVSPVNLATLPKYTGAPKATLFQPPPVATTTANNAIPTHEALMRHLVSVLKVDYSQVFTGIAVEQMLVNFAQITTIQTGAQFRRLGNGDTRFWLRLEEAEKRQFIECYGQQFQGLIRQTGLDREFVTFDLDTNILFNQVVQTLGTYRQQHNIEDQSLAHQSQVAAGWCLLQ